MSIHDRVGHGPTRRLGSLLGALAVLVIAACVVAFAVDHAGRHSGRVFLAGFASCDGVQDGAKQLDVTTPPTYTVRLNADGTYRVSYRAAFRNTGSSTCRVELEAQAQRPTLVVDGRSSTGSGGQNRITIPPDGREHSIRFDYAGTAALGKAGLGRTQTTFLVFNDYPPGRGDQPRSLDVRDVEVIVRLPHGATPLAGRGDLSGVEPVQRLSDDEVAFAPPASGHDSVAYPIRFDSGFPRELVQLAPYALTAAVTVLALLIAGFVLGRRRAPRPRTPESGSRDQVLEPNAAS